MGPATTAGSRPVRPPRPSLRCAPLLARPAHIGVCRTVPGVLRFHWSDLMVPDAKYLIDPGPCPLPLAATYTCSGLTTFSAVRKARWAAHHSPNSLRISGVLLLCVLCVCLFFVCVLCVCVFVCVCGGHRLAAESLPLRPCFVCATHKACRSRANRSSGRGSI